jgi:hypothetical protein
MHGTTIQLIALLCSASVCFALHSTAPHSTVTALHCTALHCTVHILAGHSIPSLSHCFMQLDQRRNEAMKTLHPAWPVLLDHVAVTSMYSTLDQQLLCTLSCVSQGMRSTVLAQEAGHLSVDLTYMQLEPQKTVNSFARWGLQRHCTEALIITGHVQFAWKNSLL